MNDPFLGVLVLIIGLVLIFAQLKLFSIDATLKRMLEILEKQQEE